MARRAAWVVVAASFAVATGAPAVRAQEAVELKLKWSPGTRAVQRVETDQTTVMNVPNMPQPMQQEMKQVQDFAVSVQKARPGGGYELEMEFLSMRMDMSMGPMKQAVDCATKPTDPMGKTLCGMIGGKVRFLLDARNGIEKVEGFDALMAKLMGSTPPEAAAMMKEILNEDSLKKMGSQMFTQGLPDKPVKVGDAWPFSVEMPLPKMAILVFKATSTFKGWEARDNRRCAVLDFAGTLSSKPIPGGGAMGMQISLKDGTSTGKTWFDPALGMAVASVVDQNMTLEVKMPPAQGGQTISTKMKQHVSTQLVSLGGIPASPKRTP